MRVVLDTSIIVAALVEAHPDHPRALRWLQRVRSGRDQGIVAAHSMAESYAVLTALPHRPRITPALAWQAISENLRSPVRIQSLGPRDYEGVLQRLQEAGFAGGIVYDALAARVAERARADRLVTLNGAHFERLARTFRIVVEQL